MNTQLQLIKKLATILSILLLSAYASFISVGLIANYYNYLIAEEGGMFYLYVFSPLLGGLFSIIFYMVSYKVRIEYIKAVFVIIFAILGSSLVHYWAINHHWVGGEFQIPINNNIINMSDNSLVKSIHDRNSAVSHKAWAEYKRRGETDNTLLIKFIELEKNKNHTKYIESIYVQEAVRILSDNKNINVIPVLKEMLISEEYTTVITNSEQTKFYPTRSLAKSLLKKDFEIDSPDK